MATNPLLPSSPALANFSASLSPVSSFLGLNKPQAPNNSVMQTSTPSTTPQQLAAASAVKNPSAPSQSQVASLLMGPLNTPSTSAQYGAIKNGATSNTLVGQLYGNQTSGGDTSGGGFNSSSNPTAPQTSIPAPTPTPATTSAGITNNTSIPSLGNSPYDILVQQALAAQNASTAFQNQMNSGLNNIMNRVEPLVDQTGQAAALQREYGTQETALTSAANNALTAAQLENPNNKYSQVPYNNQLIDSSGKAVNGGTAGSLPASAQSFVNSLATQIQNGQMTRAAAESELSTYGVAGLQALNTALGSGFNTNASNASAATTATGQQIQAAITPANQALDALQSAFSGLSGLQQGNISLINASVPILGQLAQGFSSTFGPGRDAASAYQGALNEARARIDGALQGVIGVDAAAAQAKALLPDNMISSEIPQKIAAAKQYLQNQLTAYTTSGQQNNSTSYATTNPPGWF